jgi:hypothetical protein
MFRLIYVSTAKFGLAETDLSNILEEATTANAQSGITGALLFNGLNFLQLLEGEQRDVRETYQRIVRDPRHTSVVTILQEDADERVFPDWSMQLKARPSTANPDFGDGTDFSDVTGRGMPEHLSRIFGNFDTLKG